MQKLSVEPIDDHEDFFDTIVERDTDGKRWLDYDNFAQILKMQSALRSTRIVKIEKQILGFFDIEQDGSTGYFALYVVPDSRGKHMAHLLVNEVVEYAKSIGVKTLQGSVSKNNLASITVLEKAGFTNKGYDIDGLIVFALDITTEIPIYTVNSTGYQVESEPDFVKIGKIVDDEIREHFLNETIVARGVASSEHEMSADKLVETIQKTGTDKYDAGRKGDRYDNIGDKQIDFFAFRRKMTTKTQLFRDIAWGFYHGAKAIHGRPMRIDVVIIYDSSAVKSVLHRYESREQAKRDGFVFRNPDDKPGAVRAIIKILNAA